MKKIQSVIGVLALVLLFSSAFNPVKTGLEEGEQAPRLSLQNGESSVSLQSLKGRYVLLNFWAGYDAPSRMENIRYARELDKSGLENISLVSVSFDTNRKVPSEQRIRQLSDFARGCYHRQEPESGTFDKTYSSIIKKRRCALLLTGVFSFRAVAFVISYSGTKAGLYLLLIF